MLKKLLGSSATPGESQALLPKSGDQDAKAFGGKNIGFIGGVSLLINNITGPAMVAIPILYQDAGWITPTICLIMMTLFGTLASSLLCEAITCIPGNKHFEGRVEFSTLVNFFFGKKGLVVAQVFINFALQCANIAAIIECSQVADDTIIAVFKKSCGLQIYPNFGWECVAQQAATDSPFPAGTIFLFTFGFIIMMLIVIPMGYLNLDDNVYMQIVANLFLITVTVDFFITFMLNGMNENVGPFRKRQASVLGVVMSNYVFITTVPSWISEKKPSVSVNRSLWVATFIASVSFFVLGYFGARSFHFPPDGDILSVINSSHLSNLFTRVLVYMFPIMLLATTIPVFCIIVRYNLLQSKLMHKAWANFFAVVLPWIVVIPFMTGSGLNNVLNWGTLLFSSVANFIIPFLIFIKASYFRDYMGGRMNVRQKEIWDTLDLKIFTLPINDDKDGANSVRSDMTVRSDITVRSDVSSSPGGALLMQEQGTIASFSNPSSPIGSPRSFSGSPRSFERFEKYGRRFVETDPTAFRALPTWFPLTPRSLASFSVVLFSSLLMIVITLNVLELAFDMDDMS